MFFLLIFRSLIGLLPCSSKIFRIFSFSFHVLIFQLISTSNTACENILFKTILPSLIFQSTSKSGCVCTSNNLGRFFGGVVVLFLFFVFYLFLCGCIGVIVLAIKQPQWFFIISIFIDIPDWFIVILSVNFNRFFRKFCYFFQNIFFIFIFKRFCI